MALQNFTMVITAAKNNEFPPVYRKQRAQEPFKETPAKYLKAEGSLIIALRYKALD